jgi:hypothetical protein
MKVFGFFPVCEYYEFLCLSFHTKIKHKHICTGCILGAELLDHTVCVSLALTGTIEEFSRIVQEFLTSRE